jgi:ankyrin repeat protein
MDSSSNSPIRLSASTATNAGTVDSNDDDINNNSNNLLSVMADSNWAGVESILRQLPINPNARDKSGRTALHIACELGNLTVAGLLLKKGADIEARYNFGRTALHVAGEAGREGVLDFLIKNGANIEAKDNVGRTVLQRVCYKGYLSLATRLLDAGANSETQDETGSYPLHSACEKGHTHITSLLLDRGTNIINSRDNFGRSGLHLACLYDHLDTVTWLCDRGAAYDSADCDGRTPLHVSSFKDHTEIVAYLVGVGANIEFSSNDGRTPLHCAAAKGHTETIYFLLDKNANTEARDAKGLTPLLAACDAGQLEAASILLDRGSDIEAQDNVGKTAMQRACEKSQWRVTSYLRDRGACLHAGFDAVDSALRHAHFSADRVVRVRVDSEAETDPFELFLAACACGDVQSVGRSIEDEEKDAEHGSDCKALLSTHGRGGLTALHKACCNGQVEVAMLLLDKGADIEARTKGFDARTPLHCAAENGHVDLVYALLNRTADVDALTKSGKTALYLVCDWTGGGDFPISHSNNNLQQTGANQKNPKGADSFSSGSGGKSSSSNRKQASSVGSANELDPDCRVEYGRENCYNRHVELACALLEFGCNPKLRPRIPQSRRPLEIVDTSGNIVLHRALIQCTYLCSYDESYFVNIILLLLKANSQGARVRNKASQFPLNIALENDASIDVVGPLISASHLRKQEINSVCRSAVYSSWCNIDALHYMLYALQQKWALPVVNLHVCGDTGSGKTTARHALTYLLSSGAPASSKKASKREKSPQHGGPAGGQHNMLHTQQQSALGSFSVVPSSGRINDFSSGSGNALEADKGNNAIGSELEPLPLSQSWLGSLSVARRVKSTDPILGRSCGASMHTVRTTRATIQIHDLAGRSYFRPLHASFVAKPQSVYVLVLSPWDYVHQQPVSDDQVIRSYNYWIRFLNTTAEPLRPLEEDGYDADENIAGASAAVIVVINASPEADAAERGRIRKLRDLIAAETLKWTKVTNTLWNVLASSLTQTVSTTGGPGGVSNPSNPISYLPGAGIPASHSGYMLRQSEVQKTWRKRYYMLHLGVLRYFDSDPNALGFSSKHRGSFSLSAIADTTGSVSLGAAATEISGANALGAADLVLAANGESVSSTLMANVTAILQQPKPVGEMFLQDYSVVVVSESRFLLRNRFRKHRELLLEVEDETERVMWLQAFRQHIAYLRSNYRVQVVGEPLAVNVSLTTEVNSVLTTVNDVIKSMTLSGQPTSRLVDLVLNDVLDNVNSSLSIRLSNSPRIDVTSKDSVHAVPGLTGRTLLPPVLSVRGFKSRYVIPALKQLRTADIGRIDDCVFQWLASLALKDLTNAGHLLMAASDEEGAGRGTALTASQDGPGHEKQQSVDTLGGGGWVVTDANWVTRDLLGRIFCTMCEGSQVLPMMTAPQLNELSGDIASKEFGGDVNVLPQLLSALFVCVPMSDVVGPFLPQPEELLITGSSAGMLLFPMFVDIPCDVSSIVPLSISQSLKTGQDTYPAWCFRKISRRFRLRNPGIQCSTFPQGYFSVLFAAIAELEHNTRDIVITSQSLVIQRCYSMCGTYGNTVQIVVLLDVPKDGQDEGLINFDMTRATSFTVTVSTRMVQAPTGRSYARRRMNSIVDLICDSCARDSDGCRQKHLLPQTRPRSRVDSENATGSGSGSEDISNSNQLFDGAELAKTEVARPCFGLITAWPRNVDVVQSCVHPLDESKELSVSHALSLIVSLKATSGNSSDTDGKGTAEEASKDLLCMFYGVNEAGEHATEDDYGAAEFDTNGTDSGCKNRAHLATDESEVFFHILEQLN